MTAKEDCQVISKVPVWYEAPSDGEMAGTPMCAAIAYVTDVAQSGAPPTRIASHRW